MRFSIFVILGCFALIVGCQKEAQTNESISHFNKRTILLNGRSYIIDEFEPFRTLSSSRAVFRIPSITITEKGTMLVTCENREVTDDSGPIDILVSRKVKSSKLWTVNTVFKNDSDGYGRSMNPVFCVDTTGRHGVKGRIFLFTCHISSSVQYAHDAKTSEIDFVYKYSDDDGVSWSPEYSLKKYWKTNEYEGVIPSPSNGIQMEDGTLIIPTMVITDGFYKSGLCIKSVDNDWFFSTPSPNLGDNESTVYLDNNNNIVLDCRTTSGCRRKYFYSIAKDSFEIIEGSFPTYLNLKAEISRVLWDNQNLFLMTFCDSNHGKRENITLWGSTDGSSWNKVFQMTNGDAITAYSNISFRSGILAAVYEDYSEGIKVQDYTSMKDSIFRYVQSIK